MLAPNEKVGREFGLNWNPLFPAGAAGAAAAGGAWPNAGAAGLAPNGLGAAEPPELPKVKTPGGCAGDPAAAAPKLKVADLVTAGGATGAVPKDREEEEDLVVEAPKPPKAGLVSAGF